MEAFLNEVHRMSSLLPMSVFHKSLSDAEFHGYLIPKGSVLFLNVNDAHHDPKYWDEPDIFKPERFLDDSGTKLVKHEALIPFGAGKNFLLRKLSHVQCFIVLIFIYAGHRQCLGEPLARETLFIFLSGLLQNFNFETDDPEMKNNVELKGTSTFISSPKLFKVIMTERR
jgi:cytochrome P450